MNKKEDNRLQESTESKQPRDGNAKAEEEVSLAIAHHRLGNLTVAEQFYLRVIAHSPGNFDALNMLGVLYLQKGLHQDALESLREAVLSRPEVPATWVNLGLAQQRLDQFEQALASYDHALMLKPDYPNAQVNRGNLLQDLSRHPDALASYDFALVLEPNHIEALFNRANVLQQLRRYEEALAGYDQMLAIAPGHPEGYLNRGVTLLDLEHYEKALTSFQMALELRPDYPQALNNCAVAQQALFRYEDALVSVNQALDLRPEYTDALSNKGHILDALGRDADASKVFIQLLALEPGRAYAPGRLYRLNCRLCHWENLSDQADGMITALHRGEKAAAPFVLMLATDSASDQQRCARNYASELFPTGPTPKKPGRRKHHDKIRLAYLSADFREHALSYLMSGLFELHDRQQFETIAISFSPQRDSEMSKRLRAAFGQFIEVFGMSDSAVVELMLELEVDIAVDLMGFTQYSRTAIFSHRPAPIQVNYLGFPATMGAEYIDYIIADEFVIPSESQQWYAEKVIYLPDTFQANDHRRPNPGKAPTRAAEGLPDSGFVFCSFNGCYKITPTLFEVWMNLLAQVPGSVLWLVGSNSTMQGNLYREAGKRGIEPQRLMFAPDLSYADHLNRVQLGDLFLDTLPYNAGSTASDALWAGVPVLTCAGEAFASRMAGSLLKAIGLPELITRNLNEYQALALKLASEPALLTELRTRLAHNRDVYPLFDTKRFRDHIESAYITMWERHQRGKPPVSFRVQPKT